MASHKHIPNNRSGSAESITVPADHPLAAEFQQWWMTSELLGLVNTVRPANMVRESKLRTEYHNNIERLMLSIVNIPGAPLQPHAPSDIDMSAAYAKFDTEMRELATNKRICKLDSAAKLAKLVVATHKRWRDGDNHAYDPVDIRIDVDRANNTISVVRTNNKWFVRHYTISPRISNLMRMAPIEDVARALVRYDALCAGSQHLGRTQHHYQQLYDFGVRFEGFASSLNSRLLMCAGNDEDERVFFYSTAPDTDAPFGAVGQFQSADIRAGQSWSVNPPFIETVMLDAAKKVVDSLDAIDNEHFADNADKTVARKPTVVFMLMPAWSDAEANIVLDNSRHLVAKCELGKDKPYLLERPDGSTFEAPFRCYYYALRAGKLNDPVDDTRHTKDIADLCNDTDN